MKRIDLPSSAGLLTLCYTPAEIALACRVKKAVILAEIKAGRLGPCFRPCDTQILVPGHVVNAWLETSIVVPRQRGRADVSQVLELHYTPGMIALACSLNKEAVQAEINSGALCPAFKPFANKVIAPASAVQRWLASACVSPT